MMLWVLQGQLREHERKDAGRKGADLRKRSIAPDRLLRISSRKVHDNAQPWKENLGAQTSCSTQGAGDHHTMARERPQAQDIACPRQR